MMNDVQQPGEVGISSAILEVVTDLQSKTATFRSSFSGVSNWLIDVVQFGNSDFVLRMRTCSVTGAEECLLFQKNRKHQCSPQSRRDMKYRGLLFDLDFLRSFS
ncbi:hypothetical protein OIU76_011510 [Salix suchowensis]|nr:hypothetical protein OIU76_011510 [Salix suchowensis]